MIILETERLRLRNWRDDDRDLFFKINSDPKVMEFFPRRRTRSECDGLIAEVRRRIDTSGLGFYALALKETDRPIGFCGLAKADLAPLLPDGAVEVGWRLALPHWGKGYVTEAASSLLRHGFESHRLDEIVSFAVATNTRSTAVMRRIGLLRDPARDFDHPRVPETSPHLKHHVVYALSREQWLAR